MYFSDSDPHRELADLGFERLPPSPWLRDVVQCYWGARARLTTPRVENLYPDGGWGLSFSFGDPPLSAADAGAGGSLDGVTARRRELALAGAIDLFGVRFQPGAASWLLGAALPEVRDRVVSLDDVGGILARLEDRLSEADSTTERAALFEEQVCRRIDLRSPGLVASASTLVQQFGGLVRIDEVAARLGVSQRQLERTFRSHVGLTPKTLARLARLRRARLALKLTRDRKLVDVALDAGYFDQAHFTRDFRELVGMTPGRYRQRAAQRDGGGPLPQSSGSDPSESRQSRPV